MVSNGVTLSNRYFIRDEIGSGGMGAVFEAIDLRTGAQVAVKVLHPLYARNPQYIQRLRREAQIAASIRTPRVVRVVDLDEHDGMPFLVMEYVAGENLSDRLTREGPLQVHEALAVLIEITRALEGAHAAGAVHRDLKPSNVKITEEGEIKVLDFGIARAQDLPGITGTNAFTGTPEYCAPERIEGEGDIRSDIYSLGVMLYELLTGALPFTGMNAFAILRKHESEPPPALPFPVPDPVQEILDRTLAKDPTNRYQTPSELMAALRSAREEVLGPGTGTPAAGNSRNRFVPATIIDPAVRQRDAQTQPEPGIRTVTRAPGVDGPTAPGEGGGVRRRGLLFAGGGVVAALVLGGAAWALTRDDNPPVTPTATASAQVTGITPTPTTGIPTPTQGRTTTPATPTPPQTALGLGDKLLLNKSDTAKVEAPAGSCRGAGKVMLDEVLVAISIERDTRQPTRVTIPYVRRIPRQQGVECSVAWLPDKESVVLQITPLVGETYRVGVAGGTGLAVAQVDDIYGKEAPGTFVFDDVQLDVSRIELIQIKRGFRLDQENPDGELHRIQLVPR